jgi:DNA-directed RNA polymerase specialized sigma24 family protein
MTTAEAYDVLAPVAIAAARKAVSRHLRTDPDFLQDVRLRAWKAACHAARRGRLLDLVPFACAVGRNAAIDHVLRLRPLGFREAIVNAGDRPEITAHGDIDEFPIVARPEPDPFAPDDLLAIADRADLEPVERVSVVLGFAYDRTHHEIARALRISQPAAKRIRVRALGKIRKVVA